MIPHGVFVCWVIAKIRSKELRQEGLDRLLGLLSNSFCELPFYVVIDVLAIVRLGVEIPQRVTDKPRDQKCDDKKSDDNHFTPAVRMARIPCALQAFRLASARLLPAMSWRMDCT
jgi:hypothetical protein